MLHTQTNISDIFKTLVFITSEHMFKHVFVYNHKMLGIMIFLKQKR